MLGPDAEHDVGRARASSTACANGAGSGTRLLADRDRERRRRPATTRPGDRVHRRVADEAGDEEVRRLLVDVLRRPDLLEHAVVHDRDAVPHRHRLDLVVGDVDDRGLEPPLQLDELGAGLHPQLRVEVRERLVHEERLGPPHDRARERDALALPARELRGLAVEQVVEPERLRPRRATSCSRSSLATLRVRSGNSMFLRTVMCG